MSFIKRTLASFFRILGYRISEIRPSVIPPDMNEGNFMEIYEKSKSFTMTSPERMYALYKAVEYVTKNRIEGDFVECGVWKGGSSMLAAMTFLGFNDKKRSLYLYDTFAGMTKPAGEDEVIGAEAGPGFTEEQWKKMEGSGYNEWMYAPLKEVKRNMEKTGYPPERIKYVEGRVEDTVPGVLPEKIAVLRLDTDWYESTSHEMEHLFPLLSPGGVLILDDYGHWAGARKAVDEYVEKNNISIILARVDNTGRMGIKMK